MKWETRTSKECIAGTIAFCDIHYSFTKEVIRVDLVHDSGHLNGQIVSANDRCERKREYLDSNLV